MDQRCLDVLNTSDWGAILIKVPTQGAPKFFDHRSRAPITPSDLDAKDPCLAAKVRTLLTLFGDSQGPAIGRNAVAVLCRLPIPHQAAAYHYLVQPLGGTVEQAGARVEKARAIFREEHRDSMRAIAASSGADSRIPDEVVPIWQNFKRAYAQYKWVFHPALVERVVAGEYDRIFPLTAEVHGTLNCTFRCTNCAYKFPKQIICGSDGRTEWDCNHFSDPQLHMANFAVMRRIIDRLVAGGTKALIFTGGGEPMLSKYTVPGMRYAKDKGLDIILYSNGSAFTEDAAAEICSISPNLVRISLNAGTDQTHRDFHQYVTTNARHFPRVLRAIEAFACGRLKQPKLRFGVGVVVNTINAGSLPEVAYRLREIVLRTGGGIDFVTFRPEFEYYGGPQIVPQIVNDAMRTIQTEVRQILAGTGIELFSLPLRVEALGAARAYDRCRANHVFGEVGPDGRMFLCCERHFLPGYEIGDLMTEPVDAIWSSARKSRVVAAVDRILGGSVPAPGMLQCPPACKPHPLNVLFAQIEMLRDRGRLSEIKQWVGLLRRLPEPPDLIV
jgi:pyruvate-formate lyase-activating enzyme